jgi:hypothetical protein
MEMLRVNELVVRVVRVAGVAVLEEVRLACCRGSRWRTDSWLCGGSGGGALASNH